MTTTDGAATIGAQPGREGGTVDVDVLAVLDFLAADRDRDPSVLAAAVRLGLPDPLAVTTELSGTPTGDELVTFATAHPDPWDQDPDALLEGLRFAGAQVLLEEPDNTEAWVVVGHLAADVSGVVAADPGAWRRWDLTPVEAVAAFRRAGRGPTYAMDMLRTAADLKTAPDRFGYGDHITPTTFAELVRAGVRSQEDLQVYLEAGADLPAAVALAQARVPAAAARYAAEQQVPAGQWAQLLAGMPDAWFPTDDRNGMFVHGFTLDELRLLVDAGWSALTPWQVSAGVHLAPRRRTRGLGRQWVLAAAQVCSLDDLRRWWVALTSGNAHSRADQALPPLLPHYPDPDEVLEAIRALTGAGLRPSHLNAMRAAGCRTVQHVLTAAEAGITGKRAKQLVELHGTSRADYYPKRIGSLHKLLGHHRSTP